MTLLAARETQPSASYREAGALERLAGESWHETVFELLESLEEKTAWKWRCVVVL